MSTSVWASPVARAPSVTTPPGTTGVSVPAASPETPMLPVLETARSSAARPHPVPRGSSAARGNVCVSEDSREKPPASAGTLTSVPWPHLRTRPVVRTPSVKICPAVLTVSVQLVTMETPSSPASPATALTADVRPLTTWTLPATACSRAARPRPSVRRGQSVSASPGACPTAPVPPASTPTLTGRALTSTSAAPPPGPVGSEPCVRTRSGPSAVCVQSAPLGTPTMASAPPTPSSVPETETVGPMRSVWSQASASVPHPSLLTQLMVASVRAPVRGSSAASMRTVPPPILPSVCVRLVMEVTPSEDVLTLMNVLEIHVDPMPGK